MAFADTDVTVGINAATAVTVYIDAATDDSANVPTSECAVLILIHTVGIYADC